jgi:hypothetical protein
MRRAFLRPRPEGRAQRGVSKDGGGPIRAADGSRRALRALLTMRPRVADARCTNFQPAPEEAGRLKKGVIDCVLVAMRRPASSG